jgi:hypothetical protein
MPPAIANSNSGLTAGLNAGPLADNTPDIARARATASGSDAAADAPAGASSTSIERAVVYDSPVLAIRPRTSRLGFF